MKRTFTRKMGVRQQDVADLKVGGKPLEFDTFSNSLRAAYHYAAKSLDMRIAIRTIDGKTIIWRVK